MTVWFGEENRWGDVHNPAAPDVLSPGTLVHAEATLKLPPGGLVLERGTRPALILFLLYSQNEGNPVLVHVGGESASRITLDAMTYDVPALDSPTSQSYEGAFDATPGGPASSPERLFPFALTGEVAKFEAEVLGDPQSDAVRFDADIAILAPDGSIVASSSSPGYHEIARAYTPNLVTAGAGEYQVRVNLFQGSGSFKLDVRAYSAR